MSREPNTTGNGRSFDQATIEAVWQKGQVVAGHDPAQHRKDACRAWMQRTSYGTTGNMGWEIDHKKPVTKGGGDDLSNLQPLFWQNNRHKADAWPDWSCAVTSRS